MKKAPIGAFEDQRLAALQSYQILDTMPEQAFDDITSLASIICGTPIALVSLVDGQRQWFKSGVGLEADETPRDISFCGHAIQSSAIFEVSNALTDERFADNPLVVGAPNIRFYAGMPLITSQGHGLGTLCVIDRCPRELTEEQRSALRVLGSQVVAQLELRKSNLTLRGLIKKMEQANREIRQQGAMLVEQSRHASLGKMAGGIAHEINNPLAIIAGLSGLVVKALSSGGSASDSTIQSVKKIGDVAFRIAKITSGLLCLADAGAHEELSVGPLSGIVTSAKSLLASSFHEHGVELGDLVENVEFECRRGQVLEIVFHLLRNAMEAFDEATHGSAQPKQRVWIKMRKGSDSFELDVCDNGPGVSPSVIAHIMEPFVTTKDPGKGVGLALSIGRTVARSHGGDLTYQRKDGVTIFTLRLPYSQSVGTKATKAA